MSFFSTISAGSYKGYQSISDDIKGVKFYVDQYNAPGPIDSTLSLDGNYFGRMVGSNVFIYSNNNNNWTLQQSFINCLPRTIQFDSTGNRFIIGSQLNGNVSIYTRTGNLWSLEQSIIANDAPPAFASFTAINGSGNTILVGSVPNSNSTGNTYYFSRIANTWSQIQKFTASPNTASFGITISLNEYGNIAIIGSSGNSNITGNTYFYARNGNSWTKQANFTGNTAFVNISNDGNFALRINRSDNLNPYGTRDVTTFKFSNTWSVNNILIKPSANSPYAASSAYLNANGSSINLIYNQAVSSVDSSGLLAKYNYISNTYTLGDSTRININNFPILSGFLGGGNTSGNLIGAWLKGEVANNFTYWAVIQF